MKKILIILLTLLFCTSCATLFPGKSYNKLKPKKIKNKSYSVEVMHNDDSVELVSYYE